MKEEESDVYASITANTVFHLIKNLQLPTLHKRYYVATVSPIRFPQLSVFHISRFGPDNMTTSSLKIKHYSCTG
jgi:hypothetical protein